MNVRLAGVKGEQKAKSRRRVRGEELRQTPDIPTQEPGAEPKLLACHICGANSRTLDGRFLDGLKGPTTYYTEKHRGRGMSWREDRALASCTKESIDADTFQQMLSGEITVQHYMYVEGRPPVTEAELACRFELKPCSNAAGKRKRAAPRPTSPSA
jgi:hypothetical protein